jgi:hypothetical protein
MIGVGGALLAVLPGPASAMPVLLAGLAGLGVLGGLIAGRAAVEPTSCAAAAHPPGSRV